MFVYTGLHYAYGPADMEEAIPSSAFSKGDVLIYDSNSSISGYPALATTATTVQFAGIAASDSHQSFANRVSFFKAGPNTVFWSVMTAGGSQMTAGEDKDLGVDGNGRPVLVDTAVTARVTIARSTNDLLQESGVSRALVTFIQNAGAPEHS